MNAAVLPNCNLEGDWLDQWRPTEHLTPERALLFAVLEDAITQALSHHPYAPEARRWILNTSTKWIFSFNCICEVFDWEPATMRRKIIHHPGWVIIPLPRVSHKARTKRERTLSLAF